MAMNSLWDPLTLRLPDPDHSKHKAAGWPELFSDLVFVSIIAELTHLNIHSISVPAAGHRFLSDDSTVDGSHPSSTFGLSLLQQSVLLTFIFGAMAWQAWMMDMTSTARMAGGQDMLGRIMNIVFMGCMVFLSANISGGFNQVNFSSVCFSAAGGMTTVLLKYLRCVLHDPKAKPLAPPMLSIAVGVLCLYAAGFAARFGNVEAAFWTAFGGMVYLRLIFCFNWLTGGLGSAEKKAEYYEMATTLDAHYVVERFGLLQIIIIGETILSVVSGAKGLGNDATDEAGNWGHFADVVMSFVIVYSNYWVYFDSVANEMDSITTLHSRSFISVQLHECLMFCNVFLAAGLNLLLTAESSDHDFQRRTARVCCYGYAALCAATSNLKLVNVYSKRAILENKRIFAMRVTGSLMFVAFLFALPNLINVTDDGNCSLLIGLLFTVAVVRILSMYVSQAFDWLIMNAYWAEKGIEKEKPLLVKPLDRVDQMVKEQVEGDMFRMDGEVIE